MRRFARWQRWAPEILDDPGRLGHRFAVSKILLIAKRAYLGVITANQEQGRVIAFVQRAMVAAGLCSMSGAAMAAI